MLVSPDLPYDVEALSIPPEVAALLGRIKFLEGQVAYFHILFQQIALSLAEVEQIPECPILQLF